MGINGDEAVAYAAKHALVDVCAAYPITPQTIIVEKFAEFVAEGEVETEFVRVESEHSALSACLGAAAAGARTFTASAANGIELMHEVIFLTSSIRQPVVMAVADRSPSGPINIHGDQTVSLAQRDTGWIMIYCENSQEAYDATLQAFRIGEHPDVQLPVMTMLDGFVLTHTLENVYLLDEADAHKFVGRRKPMMITIDGKQVPLKLDPKTPITIGPLQLFDYYMESKLQHSEAMEKARPVITEINNALADHIAERIQFQIAPAPADWGYDLEDLFPDEKDFPQKELVPASEASLYDQVQVDSDVETRFVEHHLNQDDEVVFYFKCC